MPLLFVRNDITKMKCDAIVNAVDNDMKPDGLVTAYAVNTVRDRFCKTEFVTDSSIGTRFD